MNENLLQAARSTRGFMPEDEGLALYEAALAGAKTGPLLEIGSYCGKSTIYLGAAAREHGTIVFSIDHHRGSEEHQVGEEFFDPDLFDEGAGAVDTLHEFRATIERAGLEDVVAAVVGHSAAVARWWRTPVGLVFIDGGHSQAAADADLDGWAPHVASDGLLAIHDVFPDPADGGRAPFNIYRRALESGDFKEFSATGSLRVLQRVADGSR
jgi:predicted O-methyltransferase YrrM